MTNLSFVERQSHVFEGRLDPFLSWLRGLEVHGDDPRGLDHFRLPVNLHIDRVQINDGLVLTRDGQIAGLAIDYICQTQRLLSGSN